MLIIMTHGNLAEGLIHSAGMIVGELKNTYAVCVQPQMSLEMVQEQFRAIAGSRKAEEHLFVMVDILSGTPCNAALAMRQELENYTILSGVNLAMVIQFVLDEGTEDDSERAVHAIEEGKKQLVNVIDMFNQNIHGGGN